MRARSVLAGLAMLAAASFTGSARAAGPGDLDPGFHSGAPVLLDLAQTAPHSSGFTAVVVDGANRVVAAGDATDSSGKTGVALARLMPNGSLDSTFGSGGSTVQQFGQGMSSNAPFSITFGVALSPDGLPVVPLYATTSDGRVGLGAARFQTNGTPDAGFGSGGSTLVQLWPSPGYVSGDQGAVGPDGSVYVSGVVERNPSTGANREFALAKFDHFGTLDSSFGNSSGAFIGSFSQYASDTGSYGGPVIVLPSGKILAGGTTLSSDSRQQVLLARFNANGTLDASFGTTGSGYTDVQARAPVAGSDDSQGSSMAVAPDNSIYVAGGADDGTGRNRFAMSVTRFGAGGAVDSTFGSGGTVRVQAAQGADVNRTSSVSAVLVQPDGKVLLVGSAEDDLSHSVLAVVRLNADGSLDSSFGSNGIVRDQFASMGPSGGTETFGGGGALTNDGALIVSGSATTASGSADALVARLLLAPLPSPSPSGGGGTPASGGGGVPPVLTGGPTSSPTRTVLAGVASLISRLLSVSGGRVAVNIGCSTAGTCAGRLTIEGTTGAVVARRGRIKRAVVYAVGSYSVGRGRHGVVTVRLTKAGLRALRGHSRLHARLVLHPTGAKPGRAQSVSLVTVRRTRG